MAITLVIYLFVLTAFFIAQHAVLIAGKITGSVIDWSPEKPRALGMRPANGEWTACPIVNDNEGYGKELIST